jgi:DNA (cytosine-5)-methyltransferase 1
MLTVLDLFSGIGGFSLGLERTGGFKTVAFCEIDNYCQRVLRKHWPDVYIHSDIRTLGAQHFEHYRKPDVIVGGFPCQDISVAGKGVGLSGERSGLWFEMLRVIREMRPTWLLIENVPNLRTKGADIVFAGLEEAGYTWTSAVVGAWAVGAPHKRDRVWILGHSKHDGSFATEVAGSTGETVCNDAQRTNEASQSEGASSSRVLADSSSTRLSTWNEIGNSRETQTGIQSRSELVGVCTTSGRQQWATEPNVGRVAHGVPDRVYRLRALGNSVVPQIPELFGRFILQAEGLAHGV